MKGRRVLILSRDDLPPDAKLVAALGSAGCAVEVKPGNGYAAMMALPHEAIAPEATGRAMVEFLTRERPEKGKEQAGAAAASAASPELRTGCHTTVIEGASPGVVETIYTVARPTGSIFGILSEPGPGVPRTRSCILFLNPGAVRHAGPNRMWVEAARRWAARGVVSLRLDLQGIGESDGEQNLDIAGLYQDQLVEQVETVMDSLRDRAGIRQFAAVGLCSGAFWAFHAAIRNPDIRGAILLNPRLFFWDPEVDRRRLLRRTASGLMDWADWRRLARGEVRRDSIKQVWRIMVERFGATGAGFVRRPQIPPEAIANAWSALERNQSRLTLIFTKGEPLLQELDEERQLPETSSYVRCIRIANSGHTFRPLWAQKLAHDLIDRELDQILRGSRGPGLSLLPAEITIPRGRQVRDPRVPQAVGEDYGP